MAATPEALNLLQAPEPLPEDLLSATEYKTLERARAGDLPCPCRPLAGIMISLASLRSDRWTAWPELVDDFIGIRNDAPIEAEHTAGDLYIIREAGREPAGESAFNLHLMRVIDEQYMKTPFYG